jgi:hypothetical protein
VSRFVEYTIFLAVLLLLQVFLFDNLRLSIYITPLVYTAFFVLLPADINSGLLLGLGLATGAAMDFFMATAGINTIASLAVCFVRPAVINVTLGKDNVRESNTPLPREHGTKRWLRYASLLVLIHCAIFFLFESLSLHYMVFTLMRMLCSAAVTLIAVWFIAGIYPARRAYR